MTDAPITISDIAVFAAVASALFAIASQITRALITYLSEKFGTKSSVLTKQSVQCNFDHKELHAMVAAQNTNIAKMLEQNGEQIKALTDINHNAQLRHQIVLAKLERLEDHVRPRVGV